MKKLSLILLLPILFTACTVPAQVTKFDSETYQPKPESYEMQILESNTIERKYKVIGQVSCTANSAQTTPEDCIIKIKDAARKMGSDAMIDLKTENNESTGSWLSYDTTIFRAKVIVFIK